MDDREVVRAFVADGIRQGFGATVNVERDVLLLDGWWHAAFRIAPDAFMVRIDEPPSAGTAMDDLVSELAARGLAGVGDHLPLTIALAYTELSLGTGVSWALWATDRASGEAALAARVDPDSSAQDSVFSHSAEPEQVTDLSAELEGARRMAGLPESVIVAVGIEDAALRQLRPAIPECRFEAVPVAAGPGACGPLRPALVLVDARSQAAKEFIMEFRADACGRFLPVVAVTNEELPLGADETLSPDLEPLSWVEPIRKLLP
ncbi:MAG TPA: hypothetical protein VK988_08785 [Acidimicrobiales bacterium]|nr:hypothetical protein [Acidimicrobiales bacterium]